MTSSELTVDLADRSVSIQLTGGGSWMIPVGPWTLVERELERADRPAPEQLTNALGIITDHLDDVLREAPIEPSAVHVTFSGTHAETLARVELGVDELPREGYELGRADADEVFRTLVSESIADRRHNPGLRPDETETIIGTCCVILAVMRRLELDSVGIATPNNSTDAPQGEA